MAFLETALACMKKTILFLVGISIMLVLFSGCIQKNVLSEESGDYTIYNYSTPGFEISQTQASEVWEKVNFSEDAKFVTREKNYSITVFVQSYYEGYSDASGAEWIVVATSIPEKTEDIKIAIFRLDYHTFDFKRSYYFSYPMGNELGLQQSVVIMEEEVKKEPHGSKFVDEKMVNLQGGNYIYSYPASYPATLSGGTVIVNKYAGRVLYYATTIWGKRQWGDSKVELVMIRIPGQEVNGTTLLPNIVIRVESISSPAYRGKTTYLNLSFITNDNIPNGNEFLLQYRKELLHMNGSMETEPEEFDLIPEKKRLIFPERMKGMLTTNSNLTINVGSKADEGDYFIKINVMYRGWMVGRTVLAFKIDKGEKKLAPGGELMTEGTWNIGYSENNPPPIDDTEKSEMLAVSKDDTYLKGKKYKLLSITSEYRDLENFSGFFAVVTFDIGDPNLPGEIIYYIIDREKKVVLKSIVTPRKPLEYFRGEAFDEAKGNFTKKWDAENFSGFWRDPEEKVSTEILTIDQSLLNNSYRVIEKHNLIYKTNLVPIKYQIFAQANRTPGGTDGFYQAIGWMGEKHVYLQGNRLARIIFEQNASDVKTLETMESWNMGDGYRLQASSIDAKTPERQAWFTFFKDNIKLQDQVLSYQYEPLWNPYTTLSHPKVVDQNDTPIFIAYLNQVYAGRYTDNADFKYAWLKSQKTTEIKVGQIYGIMEVTSVDNGTIELRNREQIYLSPGHAVNLMGDFNIQVGDSKTSLSFHPFRVIRPV